MLNKRELDKLYNTYNKREYVHPDPLEFLYQYDALEDREIAGLVASSLAYGRVAQILKSVSYVLDIMGPMPCAFLENASYASLCKMFAGFRHRFATGDHVSAMLMGAKHTIRACGSFYQCFLMGLRPEHETIFPALSFFVQKLTQTRHGDCGHLIPVPERGSACKRLNLFLRWMVRKDDVDPGGWDNVPRAKLIIPLDVHMHRICLRSGLTTRKQANMRTAIEITSRFKNLVPDDPVRYDFSLTRLGIREGMDPDEFLDV